MHGGDPGTGGYHHSVELDAVRPDSRVFGSVHQGHRSFVPREERKSRLLLFIPRTAPKPEAVKENQDPGDGISNAVVG
jgi:hypothetical protein